LLSLTNCSRQHPDEDLNRGTERSGVTVVQIRPLALRDERTREARTGGKRRVTTAMSLSPAQPVLTHRADHVVRDG
jgi:hypothetical protein